VEWITYQRRTFVTPAFPAFISGHSTFSRAGAEVLASLTGSPYFPGGFAEFVAHKDVSAVREGAQHGRAAAVGVVFRRVGRGGQSRLWGSIHIAPDDFAGRRVGHQVGLDAAALVQVLLANVLRTSGETALVLQCASRIGWSRHLTRSMRADTRFVRTRPRERD
jgi:hypothetical protein